MDPFERHIRERGAVEDAVRAGRAVREVERRSRRVSMKPRTPQRPAGSDLAWIRNNSGMAKMGSQLNNSQADRSGNVAKAKAAGTFDRTRETYNTANAAKGYFMNEDGTIAEPGTAPKAPAPPEKPKGPPAAPQAPAPPQAKTPTAPATPAPATPAAKAAPKTTPQMQEFFKSHAKQSGRENQYFDDKGNPKGKQAAPTPQLAVAATPEPISIDQTIAQAKSANDVVRSMQRKHAPENTTPEGREKIISSLPDYAPTPKVAESKTPATPPVETPKPQPTAPPAMKKSFAGQIMDNIKANTKGTPVGNLLSDASKEVTGYAKAVAPGIKAVNAAVGAAVKPLANAAVEAPRKTGEAIANSPGFKGSQVERNIAAKKKPAVTAN